MYPVATTVTNSHPRLSLRLSDTAVAIKSATMMGAAESSSRRVGR